MGQSPKWQGPPKPFKVDPPGWMVPDFNTFAAEHAWVGGKVGGLQAVGSGYVQHFQNASAYAPIGQKPHEVHGAIRDRYIQLGGPLGFLGYPTTDETGTSDNEGRFNHFDGGSIYAHPLIGAFEVHGAIRERWATLGWEKFGYPLNDESAASNGGRFNHFRQYGGSGTTADGSIYWTSRTGAKELHGGIRDKWAVLGWDHAFLGYPVTGEYDSNGDRRSDFEYGSIVWRAGSGAEVKPQYFVVDAPNIVFGVGIAVGGYSRLTVFSDGTTHFQGHLHASGFPSYDCLVVLTVKASDDRAYPATRTGRVHGSDEPGDRSIDWDEWGTDDGIRDNWPQIGSGATGIYHAEVTSDWSAQKIAEDILAVVGFVITIIPLIFSGGGGGKSSDPNYGRPEDYPPGGLPPPDQSMTPGGGTEPPRGTEI